MTCYTVHLESIQTLSLFSHFVILQPYAKIVSIFFSLINLQSIPHNDKMKTRFRYFCKCIKNEKLKVTSESLHSTYLKHLGQQLQLRVFLSMKQQALHMWIWGFSAILLRRSSQALSGWMGTIGRQQFSGLSRDVRFGSRQGSDWATQWQSQSCPSATPVCVLRVIGLLQGEPSAPSKVRTTLDEFSLTMSLYFAPFSFTSTLPLKNTTTAWCCQHHA